MCHLDGVFCLGKFAQLGKEMSNAKDEVLVLDQRCLCREIT
jgi:hypothetical protein